MAKMLTTTTTYDAQTRILQTTVLMTGFVEDLPDQVITKQEVTTITLFADTLVSPSDNKALVISAQRAMNAANLELSQWAAASANKDKSDQFIASEIDPVDAFDDILISPITPISDDPGVMAFDAALNPPT